MPNLVERLLTYNELTGKQKFIVYSIFDSRAQLRSREFRRTEFRYIHNDSICSKIRRLGWTIWNRLTQRYDGSEYIRDVVHDLKKHADPVSYVIIENAPRFSMYLRRHFPDAELILHLHNDWVNPEARYYRRIINSTDVFWGCSNFICNRINEEFSSKTVAVLYNGVNRRFFRKTEEGKMKFLRDQLGIGAGKHVIVFSGRIEPDKGVTDLLKAYRKLKTPNCVLLILGGTFYQKTEKTSYYREVCALAKKSPQPVIFAGYIPYEEIPDYLSLADLCIVPSAFQEPFGMVVVEAMVRGLPVIASKVGGIPEIIDQNSGILIPREEQFIENLAQAADLLLQDGDLREQISKNAVQRAGTFSEERMCEEFYRRLEELESS